MKKILFALLTTLAAGSGFAADVGVSVSIGDPNFYGQIDIGNVPRPPVIYSQPVIISHPAVTYVPAPLYLRVPPVHAKNWRKYCYRYDACGRPVYFVQDSWYSNVYAPQIRAHRYDHDDHDRDHYGRGRDNDRRYDQRDDRGDHRGRGHEDDRR